MMALMALMALISYPARKKALTIVGAKKGNREGIKAIKAIKAIAQGYGCSERRVERCGY